MELKDRGSEVFKARKEKMKQIQKKKKEEEENYKKKLEHYGSCILTVFDASNLEQDSDILVWNIMISRLVSGNIHCEVDFTTKDAEEKRFLGLEKLEKWEYPEKVKNVISAMRTIEAFESTLTIVKDIGEFLQEHLDEEKYSIVLMGANGLIISMNEPTISEEE